MNREREGLFLCLISAAGFGAMPIFAKQAYAAGLDVTSLLALRFAMASLMLWALIAVRRRPLGSLRALAAGGALGLVGYSVQAGLVFAALERIDAGLVSLLVYAYPTLVTVTAIALRREAASRRKFGALALASSGVVLVLAGGGAGALDPLGAGMALAAACVYSGFIVTSERVAARTPAIPFAAAVATGAGVTFGVAALLGGGIDASGEGVMWASILASASTVLPIVAFTTGILRVGPSTASIASTVEPPFTVALAWLVFGEALGPLQLAGGALVLSAVVLLQARAASQAQVASTVSRRGRGVRPAAAAAAPDIP
jgi:drug/metabolite transporter (DMT)-like permease